MRDRRSPVVVILMFATANVVWAACEATGEARDQIISLEAVNAADVSLRDLLESRWRLARQYPEDYHVQAFAQDMLRMSPRLVHEWDRALEHYRNIGHRDTRELLEARLWYALDPTRSREMVRQVLARRPESPEAHLAALEMESAAPHGDFAEGEKHFRELRRLCPASVSRFLYLRVVQDAGLMAASLQEARRLLSGRSDAVALRAWGQAIEYLYLAKDPFLETDVKKLRALNLYDRDDWVNLMAHAYGRTRDSAARVELMKEVARRRPASSWGVRAATGEWRRTHPAPVKMDRAGFAAHRKAERDYARSLWEKYPESPAAMEEYLSAAGYGQDSTLTDEEAVRVLELMRSHQGHRPFGEPAALREAAVYVARKIRLEDVPRLVEDALRESEEAARYELLAEERKPRTQINLAQIRMRARGVLAGYYLLRGEHAQTETLIAEMRADLASWKPGDEASPYEQEAFANAQKIYLDLARRAGVAAVPVVAPREIDWERVKREPLAGFEARDLAGRNWTKRDLAGKVALVNLWATWCAPCRAEFPWLQRLHEEGRLVLAVSIDSDPALVRRFIKENGYTIPVIIDQSFADKIGFMTGPPQNHLIDREGRKLVEPVNGSGEEWFELVRELMDRLAR